jgi:hypothetical protein
LAKGRDFNLGFLLPFYEAETLIHFIFITSLAVRTGTLALEREFKPFIKPSLKLALMIHCQSLLIQKKLTFSFS